MTYPESARWPVHYMACDPASDGRVASLEVVYRYHGCTDALGEWFAKRDQ